MDVDADVDGDQSNMRVLAIDPGVTGALAVIQRSDDGRVSVERVADLPTIAETSKTGRIRRQIDALGLAEIISDIGPCDKYVVERLNAPPGIASVVAFSLGATAATIGTVLRFAQIRPVLVSPNVWKRAMGAPADKEGARKLACKLFGTDKHWARKKDHNRAEAALLALWGAMA